MRFSGLADQVIMSCRKTRRCLLFVHVILSILASLGGDGEIPKPCTVQPGA
jgi:hypothetical protein